MFGSGLDDAETDAEIEGEGEGDDANADEDALVVRADDGAGEGDAALGNAETLVGLGGVPLARASFAPRRAARSSSCCHSHCHRPCHSHSVSAARAADADARSRAPATTPSTETPRPKLPAHDARVGGGARAGERPAVSDGLGFDADAGRRATTVDVGAPSDFAFALARALAASSSTADT